MRATRRNVLVILGVLTIAGGALFGTGAFTQVEADRGVDVQTASNDASALLGMEITNSGLAAEDGNNGAVVFDTNADLNPDATTWYNNSFEITNNGDDPVELSIVDGDGNELIENSSAPMHFEPRSDNTVSVDGTVAYDVGFNTSAGEIPNDITVIATDSTA